MADHVQRAHDLVAESKELERRSGKDRRGIGAKMPCPTCGSWQSTVVNRSLTQREEGYLRNRRCFQCGAEYETLERITRLVKVGKRLA